mmetsp:Transcript_19080/g.24888  ORF Transcript_19080/g.24888 Transcript_19080/m.24888 type:complete len:296 (-) Transcript_19080:60-947(-)
MISQVNLHLLGVLISLVSVVFCSGLVNDYLSPDSLPQMSNASSFWASLLGFYLIFMLTIRSFSMDVIRLMYEMLWACNVAMLIAIYGFMTNRPRLVSAATMSVSIDQVMWYVDVVGFILSRMVSSKPVWIVGVAKYLVWPETSWGRRITSIHHLWFIPMTIYTVGIPTYSCNTMNSQISVFHSFMVDFTLSMFIVVVIAILARILTPFHENSSSPSTSTIAKTSTTVSVYLNINLVYEVWPDVKVPILQCSHPNPIIHLSRLLFIWSSLNLICSGLLTFLSWMSGDSFSGTLMQC